MRTRIKKSIQLRFGQRISSVMLHRILRGDHQKRLRQFVRVRVDRDLAFVHGFEQRRLRLRRGAVDLVGQQHVGEDRAALELELLLQRGVHRDAEHVGRQHVAGELHALKGAIDGAGERLSQRSLADSGNAFDQQVSAGEDADQREAHDIVFAANHAAQRFFQFGSFVGYGNCGLRRHWMDFTIWRVKRRSYRCHGP